MGKSTDSAWKIMRATMNMDRKKAGGDVKIGNRIQGSNQANGGDAAHLDLLKEAPHKQAMVGSVIVKDKNENKHCHRFAATDANEVAYHVELKLIDKLVDWLESGVGLASPKVIFFINKSPCPTCSEVLIERLRPIAVKLPHCDISFVYNNYFVGGTGFRTSELAQQRYDALLEEARGEDFSLRIRSLDQTVRHNAAANLEIAPN